MTCISASRPQAWLTRLGLEDSSIHACHWYDSLLSVGPRGAEPPSATSSRASSASISADLSIWPADTSQNLCCADSYPVTASTNIRA